MMKLRAAIPEREMERKVFMVMKQRMKAGGWAVACRLFVLLSVQPALAEGPLPDDMECLPRLTYGYRPDGKAGREVSIVVKGTNLYGKATLTVTCEGREERTKLPSGMRGGSAFTALLPAGASSSRACEATFTLRCGERELVRTITVPAQRLWTVYLYNHSHVDIGYTAPQEICEFIHARNIEEGIKLAEATKDYPAGARYRWNPEVTWPLERLWQSASDERKERVLKAIRRGQLCVDAGYVHLDTSACSDEELFQAFRFSSEMRKLSGVPLDTFQQMDVPGMSWGLVPVLAQEGVRYVMSWPNSVRAGHARKGIDGRPFWWVGPDGKSKVLYLQPGGYANSGSMDKGRALGRPWFGQRDPEKIPAVIKTGSANVDFTGKLADLERGGFPYDFAVLSWSLWDNSPLDADLPDAVKAWNEAYASPRIVIAGGHEIMSAIERKYGDKIPVVTGDFTEYWTDGLGSAARLTAINRNAKERLVQAETLWAMLRPGKAAPRADFDEAWRTIALGSEHTWCAENPDEPFFQEAIWKVKQSYFREADDRSRALLDKALAPAADKSDGALGPAEGPSAGGVAVFNTHSWRHGGLVTLSRPESARGDRVTDERGEDVRSQRLSTGELAFLADDVPALGSRHYRVVKGLSRAPGSCKVTNTTLDNGLLRVTLDPATGNIASLIETASGREFADVKADGGLNAFRWMPGDSDAASPDTDITLATVEAGPLVVEMRVRSKAPGCRAVTRSARLVHGEPCVEIENTVDKLPLTAKDGVHFGFGFAVPMGKTRVDIPWGVMRLEEDQWPAANRNWLALQRWLDISGDTQGITWCSLDAPLFESGAMTANQTGSWSKERKPWLAKLESSSQIYSWVMNNHWFTNFPLTQDGPVTFRYRIRPHGAYDAVAANRFGLEQAQPLVHVVANSDPALMPLVTIDNEHVSIAIVKPSLDGRTALLRLRSLSAAPETVRLYFPSGAPKSISMLQGGAEAHVHGPVALLPNGVVSLQVMF